MNISTAIPASYVSVAQLCRAIGAGDTRVLDHVPLDRCLEAFQRLVHPVRCPQPFRPPLLSTRLRRYLLKRQEEERDWRSQ